MIIFLAGFRGTGKSTIAPLVASQLECHWQDVDDMIQLTTGQSIVEIFDAFGEFGFREIERIVVRDIVLDWNPEETMVLSLGGGAVLDPQTRELMAQHGKCVWLRAPAEVLWQRLSDDQAMVPRPALTDLDPWDEIQALLGEREPVYADCADYDIDTSQFSPEQVADQIVLWWKQVDTT